MGHDAPTQPSAGSDLFPDQAADAALAWLRTAERLLGKGHDTDIADVRTNLCLPLLLEPRWPDPKPPLAVGNGWVQADLSPDDVGTFSTLRSTLPSRTTAEQLAATAQEWRLPVVPYRSEPWHTGAGGRGAVLTPGPRLRRTPGAPLAGIKVVDLTAMWAGPLATQLLRRAGASVTKVDPARRPDGFRAWPRLHDELNAGKEIVDLDLTGDGRDEFERLVADSDILVSSFSRRVLPNLGYDAERLRVLNPRLATLAIVGFPLGCPEQDWLAFGTGIHAVSGHGIVGGVAKPARVGYPDAVAGYAAFATALTILGSSGHREVSLIGALATPPDDPVSIHR